MKTILTATILSLFCIQISSQTQVYSFDENLEIPIPIYPRLNKQSAADVPPAEFIDNVNWGKDFSVPGIIGNILVTATDGVNLYIGGNFSIAGGVIANSIVKWDGQKWSSLGEGPENGVSGNVPSVEAIAISNGKVFIGGQFLYAGSERVNGVAYWDGSKWNKLGHDSINGVRRTIFVENDTIILSGFVYALLANKNKIYVGGDFDQAGVIHSRAAAVWDLETETWEDLEGGLLSTDRATYAYDFAARGDELYVGGKFNYAGEIPVNNIARWDSNGWSAIGNAYGNVYDLEFDTTGALYATGYYPANDSSGSSGLGKWDGDQWTSISGPQGLTSNVHQIQIYGDGFFAAGYFGNDTLIPAVGLAQWDGNKWNLIRGLGQSSNVFIHGGVNNMELIGGRLYVTGNFTKSGSSFAVNVAEWDIKDSSWKLLDDGNGNQGIHDGWIYTMVENGDSVYAGGSFTIAGGVYARNIAKWTGKGWQPVGRDYENGIRGSVYSILADNDTLYVGGYFGNVGSAVAFHIAKWDGKNWSSIGIGVGGVPRACVYALAKIGNYLYAAGYFSAVGDEENYTLPANSIARFNLFTNRWETLGKGIEYVSGIPGRVFTLATDGNKLYAGGEFHSADDNNYNNFAVLTDNKWSGIDGYLDIGVEGQVSTIKVINGEIYIGGQLKHDGESTGILKWDDKKWSPVGDPLMIEEEDPFISDIEPFRDGFIAGGHFTMAGNIEANNIAYFDGNNWNDIEGGIFPGVNDMAFAGDKLFVSGPKQLYAAGVPGVALMSYDFYIPTQIEEIATGNENPSLWNYPNPYQLKTTIGYTVSKPGRVRLSLFDIRGREIRSLFDEYRNIGRYEFEFNAGDLPAGIYLSRMIQGYHSVTSRMVILQ